MTTNMQITTTLPSLTPIPPDIADHLSVLVKQPATPGVEAWLLELIQNSNHMSTADDIRWRTVVLVWLTTCFDIEKGWPYLMWFNQQEPVIGEHLVEILGEGASLLGCEVQLIGWMDAATDNRLTQFFSGYAYLPPEYKLPKTCRSLMARPTAPETGRWLAYFCRHTAAHRPTFMRAWRLLFGAWTAAVFEAEAGLAYLRTLTDGATRLSPQDNKLLMDLATEHNVAVSLTQWLANATNAQVKTLFQDFGHPDLPLLVESLYNNPPTYDPLPQPGQRAKTDALAFERNVSLLEGAGVTLKTAQLLDLACGPLAPQTVLFNAAGYRTTGTDIDIMPRYLPMYVWRDWFRRHRLVAAWNDATGLYYKSLAERANLPLKWGNVTIRLADLTRLPFEANSFDAVLCTDHLQHAPDVAGLLGEAARVLKSGGVLLADLRPYAAYRGAFQETASPWSHLLAEKDASFAQPLNKWRESDYRAALEQYFSIEQWLTTQADDAPLTPDLAAQLSDYTAEELTRREIVIVARKK